MKDAYLVEFLASGNAGYATARSKEKTRCPSFSGTARQDC